MSEILITGPGRYPMRNGNIAIVDDFVDSDDYRVKGMMGNGLSRLSWTTAGCYWHGEEAHKADIIGPRIEDEPASDLAAKPSPMDRLDAYAAKWVNVTLFIEPSGGDGWWARLRRMPDDAVPVRIEANGHGDTMSAAIADVMDAVEGVS
jgi:hypothetical protein